MMKLQWKLIKQVLKQQKKTSCPLLEIGNRCATTSEDEAELLNTYFEEQSNIDDGGRRPDTSNIEQAKTHFEKIYTSHIWQFNP